MKQIQKLKRILIICLFQILGFVGCLYGNEEQLASKSEGTNITHDKQQWVIVEKVALQKEPSPFSDRVCLLHYGQSVDVVEMNMQWVKAILNSNGAGWIESNGHWITLKKSECDIKIQGWIHRSSLSEKKPKCPANAVEGEGQSPSSKIPDTFRNFTEKSRQK